jgi:hypothetical protein
LGFLLSLFRLKQETAGPTLAFELGVFLKLQESGLDIFLPEVVAVLGGEAYGEKKTVKISVQITLFLNHFLMVLAI